MHMLHLALPLPVPWTHYVSLTGNGLYNQEDTIFIYSIINKRQRTKVSIDFALFIK